MRSKHFRFSLSQLFIVVTFMAIVAASAMFLPSVYYMEGLGAIFIYLLFGLFVICTFICLCFRRLRIATLVTTMVVCGLFIYRQSILIERQKQLEAEVARIVDYVEAFKTAHNEFPRDLSGYYYQRPELQQYIAYSPPGGDFGLNSYHINYHPTGTYQGIGHWYFGDRGYWFEDD